MLPSQTSVDDPVLHALEAAGEALAFDRDHVIFTEGEPSDRLYFIQSGKVKITRQASHDKKHMLALFGPSNIFGEVSLYDPKPRGCTATAVTEVHLLSLDRPMLRHWIAHDPNFSEGLLRALARRLRDTHSTVIDSMTNDARGRLAKVLIELAMRFGSRGVNGWWVTHDLKQVELAQLVGATRETVNKVLNDFADRGLLRLVDRGVVILDPERLARRAN
ncbi:MAG: Crp/Fnr family transcriptional regulator [Saccharothrix sp.]|nr:Crp/Fnr family transcriptional regulator [Saccharothrix sp.]